MSSWNVFSEGYNLYVIDSSQLTNTVDSDWTTVYYYW